MESASEENKRVIGCISLSRGKVPLIGLCVYDTVTYVLDVYEFSDTLLFTNLNKQVSTREISLVLVPENQKRTFKEVIESNGWVCFQEVPRSTYDASMGEAFIQRMKGENFVLKFKSEERYFSLSSVAALVTYLTENFGLNMRAHFSDINFLSPELKLFMSQKTVEDLELVESISKSGTTLFSVLKMTKTRMGTRLLRRNIMEPSCDIKEISRRYEFVRFLKENQGVATLIERCLNNFIDADQLFSRISKRPSVADKKSAILAVVELFSLIYSIRSLVETIDRDTSFLENCLLKELYGDLKNPEIDAIESKLRIYIEEKFYGPRSILNNNQYIYALKQDINPILDLSKKIYFENLEDLEKLVDELYSKEIFLHRDPKKGYILKTKNFEIIRNMTLRRSLDKSSSHNISYEPSVISTLLKSKVSASKASSENTSNQILDEDSSFKRHKDSRSVAEDELSLSKEGDAKQRHENFIYLFKRNETVFFTTLEIQKVNSRLNDASEKIVEISSSMCISMIEEIEEKCNALRVLGEKVALIDMLFSFYLFSQKHETTIPIFSDTFIFTDSSNLFLKKQKVKKNSFYACDLLNFNIVTGKNMSGKTTYAKQAAYNVILAQIGCPINSKFASTKIFKNILTRLSNEDDTSRKLSTFGVEISEAKLILEYAGPESLVLIDELGRGTNSIDGMAFALTVSEYLIEKKAYVYFITHFKEIIPYLEHNRTVNVLQGSNFNIFSGVNKETNGIELASEFLPRSYINDALELRKTLCMYYEPGEVEFNNSYVQMAVKIINCKSNEEEVRLRKEVLGMLRIRK